MKKKVLMLIPLAILSLNITACGGKSNETNEAQQVQNTVSEATSVMQEEVETKETQETVSAEDMLFEINNWVVGDVWNSGFCDFYHYEEDGTSSTGENIDIEFALEQFKKNYEKKIEYDDYIHSLPSEYEEIQNIWDKLMEESDILYEHYQNGVEQTGTAFDTAIFVQYRDAFSEAIDEMDFANTFSESSNEDADQNIDSGAKVEVDKGLIDVTLNIPPDLVGDTTQEELDATCKEKGFKSIVLNDDGSATYTMTKEQHKKLMEEYKIQIDNTINEMIGSEDYPNITSIEANDNYTEFTVATKNKELDMAESFSAMSFYMYGGIYNAFNGENVENISVTFINADSGDVIETVNSSDMGQ